MSLTTRCPTPITSRSQVVSHLQLRETSLRHIALLLHGHLSLSEMRPAKKEIHCNPHLYSMTEGDTKIAHLILR